MLRLYLRTRGTGQLAPDGRELSPWTAVGLAMCPACGRAVRHPVGGPLPLCGHGHGDPRAGAGAYDEILAAWRLQQPPAGQHDPLTPPGAPVAPP